MDNSPTVSLPASFSPCQTCKHGDRLSVDFRGVGIKSLEESAQAGCSACFDGPAIDICPPGRWWDLTAYIYRSPGSNQVPCPAIGLAREIDDRRDSFTPGITEWLRNCRENHPDCADNHSVLLPSRVLDIGYNNSEWIKLKGASGQEGSYTALSHCWGGGIAVRMVMANLGRYKEGIRYSDLPLTFQHAVTVTRGLGIKYLWIDALCIIQDDQDDWQQESGNMAAIYRDAYFVIGADMSRDSNGGFLDVSETDFHDERKLIGVDDKSNPIYVREEYRRGGEWDQPLAFEPLKRRAWTLQEQILATRMVHFTSQEMVWECKYGLICQCMHLDRAGGNSLQLRGYFAFPFPRKFKAWYQVVNEVMQRHITKPEDILPCLSGLARLLHGDEAGCYLAGLWSNDLPAGLLWIVNHPGKRPNPYRGPSWSWVSVDQRYSPYPSIDSFRPENEDPTLKVAYAKVLEVECTPSGKDPLGTISSGFLKISGPLIKLTDEIIGERRALESSSRGSDARADP
ncbi:uncharacterized protein FIESC28_00252 [Fusarium coffeatum]|uniref:Heterokaryon incompatibility domain-containing protein n=1 Tax=Fusarium coffeatum TaxID=231269 RepID=A0A366SCE6_9HYPO|nr:uncharacterized protein FIESC28_00252 [Fusarium coffeatum]RBR26984.1 hypothetical protein FIESC28_00252 [Fusarium coffeatum]